MRSYASAVAAVILLLSQGPAWAADAGRNVHRTPVEATPAYEATRVRRRQAAAPQLPPPVRESIGTTSPGGQVFVLKSIEVVGATAIPHKDIAATFQEYIGKSVATSDLIGITEAITALYRNAGFSLSRAIIPPQDINNGRVRVEVLEGYIADIAIEGTLGEDFGAGKLLGHLQDERPLRQSTLERQLLLVHDTPGLSVADTALEEMGGATGRFRLVVTLGSWHVYLGAELDNRGTSAVGRVQGYLSPAINSAVVSGDTLSLSLSSVPLEPQELGLGRIVYDAPLGSNGTRISASASHGQIRPGDERRYDDNYTSTTRYEIKGTIAPVRSREFSLRVSVGGDLSDVRESDDDGTISDDHVRALTLAADVELHDGLGGTSYFTAQVRQGLNILGASTHGDAPLSRDDGTGAFTAARLFYTRYQRLTDAWSLWFAGAGQLASTALLASEEFYLGGASFGRAYDSGAVSGDDALAASLEIRFDQVVEHAFVKGYQLYAFADYGVVWARGAGPDDRSVLTSAGGGARLFLADDLQASLELAAPLSEGPVGEDVRGASIHFSLSQSFKACPGAVWLLCPNS